jgi:diguanylate cyclase (GGDEF)-like protein
MFLDVDNFKNINDTHGHQVGDGVLRVLAAIVSAHATQFSGYPARFGGEELVVLCEGLDESHASARAEEIRQDVARCPFVPHLTTPDAVPPLHVTVSIGVAQIGPGQNGSDLVLAADRAMYAANPRGATAWWGTANWLPTGSPRHRRVSGRAASTTHKQPMRVKDSQGTVHAQSAIHSDACFVVGLGRAYRRTGPGLLALQFHPGPGNRAGF